LRAESFFDAQSPFLPPAQALGASRGHAGRHLGRYGTRASRREYDRLIGGWLAGGRALPPNGDGEALTVAEVALRFWNHAKVYRPYLRNTPAADRR